MKGFFAILAFIIYWPVTQLVKLITKILNWFRSFSSKEDKEN